MKTYIHYLSYLAQFFSEREMFQICRGNQNVHFVCNNFFGKSFRLWDNVEKYFKAGQFTDGNMAHVHCMLDT